MSCLDDFRALHTAILARATGRTIQSSGHKDRSAAFANADLGLMVKLYTQLRSQCPEAKAELPELTDLEASTATRGVYRVRLRS